MLAYRHGLSLLGDKGIKEVSFAGETRATEGSGGDVHLLDGSGLMLWKRLFSSGGIPGFFTLVLEAFCAGRSGVKKGGNYGMGKRAEKEGVPGPGGNGVTGWSGAGIWLGAAGLGRVWGERRTEGPLRKEGPGQGETCFVDGLPGFGALAIKTAG
jgi:hypothetical protein